MLEYYTNVRLRALAMCFLFAQLAGLFKLGEKVYMMLALNRIDFSIYLSFIFILAVGLIAGIIFYIRQGNAKDLTLAIVLSIISSCMIWGAIFTP